MFSRNVRTVGRTAGSNRANATSTPTKPPTGRVDTATVQGTSFGVALGIATDDRGAPIATAPTASGGATGAAASAATSPKPTKRTSAHSRLRHSLGGSIAVADDTQRPISISTIPAPNECLMRQVPFTARLETLCHDSTPATTRSGISACDPRDLGAPTSLGGGSSTVCRGHAVTEDALVSQMGRQLTRLPGHIAYWFA